MSVATGAEKTLALLADVEDGRAEPEALAAFVSASPENLGNVLLLTLPQEAAKGFSPQTRRRMEAMLSDRVAAAPDWAPPRIGLVRLRAEDRAPSWLMRRVALGLAAALVVASVIGFFGFWEGEPWQSHHTVVGQSLAVNLDDGTQVVLNTATELEVRLTPERREVRILRGEASFNVSSDTRRPFIVEAGSVRVRTLGTMFDVYMAGMHTDVAVTKGVVAVSFVERPFSLGKAQELRVKPGLGVRLRQDGSASALSEGDFMNAVDWESGRMRFLNETLSKIAGEFNRYNDVPKIDVLGDAAEKRFSGIFVARDPDAFTALVSADPAYEVTKKGRTTVIQLRKK